MRTASVAVTVRGGRVGSEGYRGCIALPTKHGEIVVCATVPDGAVRAWRDALRGLLKHADEIGAEGPSAVEEIGAEIGAPSLSNITGALQQGLSALGPLGSLAGSGLSALGSLFGGGTYGGPVIRPGDLPPEGGVQNLARIARHVGIAPGMPVDAARARLENGLRQNWAGADHADARRLLAALPRVGPTVPSPETLAALAAAAAGIIRPTVPSSPSTPLAAPVRPAAAPAPALATIVSQLLGGSMTPAAAAPALGAASAVQQAYDLATGPAATALFGPSADPFAEWLGDVAESTDAVAGDVLLDSRGAREWLRSRETHLDPRVISAVEAARRFHDYLHGVP